MSDNDASVLDFMFGFNDRTFSDRELIIDILPENVTGPESGHLHPPENDVESDCSISSEGCSEVLNFHVNSLLLAKKSPFFHKLFANGMMESKQRCVTMRIQASEETAFVELLKYMYGGTLTIRSAPALLDVLKLADRFEVISCMRLCVKLLIELPMTTELALLCLDFTSSTSRTDEVQLLADATKRFLEDRYNDIDKVQNEIMEMSLDAMEIILSSDVLKVFSEDTIFDVVVNWIETRYPKLEDQKNILSSRLGKYIRFPYLSLDKLREALSCNILDDGFANKAVIDALFFKVKSPHHHHHHHYSPKSTAIEDSDHSDNYHPYIRRGYEMRPIKVLPLPCQGLIVHFDLKFDECVNMKPRGYLLSDTFSFGGLAFKICVGRADNSVGALMFYVGLFKSKPHPLPSVRYEFSAWSECLRTFDQKQSVKENDKQGSYVLGSYLLLYTTPWSSFEAGQILDSIDGYLLLEVKLISMQ